MVNTHHSNGNSSLEIAQSSQELVSKDRSNRKRTCVILAAVGVGAVLVLVAAVVVTSGGGGAARRAGQRPGATGTSGTGSPSSASPPALALEDFLEGHLVPRSFNATWISDKELLYQEAGTKNLVLRDVSTGTSRVLVSSDKLPPMSFDWELSADRRYLLVAHGYQKLYSRYSFLAHYAILDLVTGERTPVTANGGAERLLRLAVWAPANNALVYVANNNLYYRPSARLQTEIQLTSDGENGRFFNGVPDWVYEEEVLSSNKALWFSKNGKRLAYLTVNDTKVGIMNIPYYGSGTDKVDFQYPKTIPLRYPKAGTPNPEVQLVTVDLDALSSFRLLPVQIAIPAPTSVGREPILGSAAWASDTTVCAVWLNRVQNVADVQCCDAASSVCDSVALIEQRAGWLEMFTAPMFSADGGRMLMIMSQDQAGGAGSYRHITLIERRAGGNRRALTRGKFVVTDILSWDEAKDLVYFVGTSEKDPAVQHLYTTSGSGGGPIRCITCSTKNSVQSQCSYNVAMFSTNSSYYALNCAGPAVPETSLYSASSSPHRRVAVWERNEELLDIVTRKQIPRVKRFEVDVGGGFRAQVSLQLPPNLDTSGEVKYPLLINVYGGPDSYDVLDKFSLNWFSYLASNKSIVVAIIDGRGSGLKGDNMLFAGYGHLGTVEIFDQINVTRHLQKELPYIDDKRTAIWGWSYGGYAAGLALARDTQNVFKCGISIAPVTDWTLYDSIYTERVMGLPAANILAYKEAALINKIDKLRGKQYLLVHGTLDDNVHYQQSMLLAKALEVNDIPFRQQTYPDEDHGLSAVRKHLYHTFESFLDECFDPNSVS